jgi:hypothetical protein
MEVAMHASPVDVGKTVRLPLNHGSLDDARHHANQPAL